MDREALKNRMKLLSVRVILMTEELPNKQYARILGDQVIRSVTSVYANYSASGRAKSSKDFINKLKIVEEEADETILWLDLLRELKVFPRGKLDQLFDEANEILAVIVSSIKTARAHLVRKDLKS